MRCQLFSRAFFSRCWFTVVNGWQYLLQIYLLLCLDIVSGGCVFFVNWSE